MRQIDNIVSVFQELKCLGVKVPKLKKFLSSIPKQARSSPPSNNKIFGINISEQEKIEVEKCLLPKFIVMAINYLKHHVNREGLFRKAGSVLRQKDLREKLENGQILEKAEPHDVACLLKQWLRELPERLIPGYLTDLFIRCINLEADNRIAAVSLCCHLLPYDHYCTLKHLLVFLSEVAQNANKNKMGSRNLSVVMAPNIFMGPNSIDKSSNVLLDHTSVIELLINNTHRIQPPCPSVHLTEAEALKCNTDLDVTTVLQDYSPSKLKKGVQDLIKKLVRKNSTSPPRKRPYQDDCDSNTRQAITSPVLHDESLCYTPNSKIPKMASNNTSEKPRKKRSRGKSFNLLKRKEKKRQKSEKFNDLASKRNSSASSPFQENLVSSLQILAPAENKEPFFTPPSISPINLENLFAVKPNSMKKSYSDFYLIPNNQKFPNKIFSMSSEGCLPAENIPLPCHNITLKAADQMDSLKVPAVIISQISESQKTENSSLVSTIEKSVSDTKIFKSKVNNVNDGVPITKSVESNVTSIIASQLQSEKIKRNCTLRRQEVFVVKPKNSKNTISQLRRADSIKISKSKNSQLKISHQNNTQMDIIKKSDSNSIAEMIVDVKVNENNASSNDKKRTKRNASIVRGRPNTVKTGLPNDVCTRYNCDSFSFSNKHKSVSVSSSVDNDLFINVVQKNDHLPIINQMQNLTLSSPKETISVKEDEFRIEVSNFYDQIITSMENNVLKTKITNCNDKIGNSASLTETVSVKNFVEADIVNGINVGNTIIKVEEPESVKIDDSKTVSKRESREKLHSNSDKVQKPKNSAKVSRINSFPGHSATTKQRKAKKLRAVKSSSPRKSCEKRGNSSDITDKENQYTQESQQQTYLGVETERVLKNSSLEPESIKTDHTKTRSKRKSRERLCSNSDSKVHNSKKKSAKVSRINSFPEQEIIMKSRKVEKLRAVKSSSPRKSCKKRGSFSDITDKENQYTQESEQQTCLDVKTLVVVKDSSLEPESMETDDIKTCSKRKSIERLCINSGSKVHNSKKKSSKVSRIKSFPEQATIMKPEKVEKLRAVKSLSPRKSFEKTVKVSENTDKENLCPEESRNHLDVKKTPKNKCESPEQWFSGRKFLEAEEAVQKDNPMDCKRESIAMILRYNKGNVREKASIYEPDTRTTPMLLRSNTPCAKFCDPQYNKQSSQKKSTSARGTRRNSPLRLPPIPLFFESSPVSSHPFKELTNLSNSEEFFTPPDKKCTLKPKMNSFSGHTPYKLNVDRNKVCRSQSSPENLSPSCNEIYHCSPILKAKSALSIERLKSDELLDEWNCEM